MSERTNPAGSEEPTTSGAPAFPNPAFPNPDLSGPAFTSPAAPSPGTTSPASPDATASTAFAATPAVPAQPPDGSSPQPSTARRRAGAVALVAGGVLAGGILATTLSAVADSDSGSSSSTQAPNTRPTTPDGAIDESQPQRSDEELLTGDVAASVEAAALEAYPGATILRLETDSDGVYEAHLVTADGQRVTVEVGEDFTVTGEEAMGPGGMGGPGGPRGHGPREGVDGGTRTAPESGLSTPDDDGTGDDGGTGDGSTT